MSEPVREIALAVVVRLGEAGPELLVARRRGEHLRGTWEFPGGKMEFGESAAAAAVRECAEELGLRVRAAGSMGAVEHDYEAFMVRLNLVRCEAEDEVAAGPDLKWISPAALRGEDIPPANHAVLDRIEAALAGERG